jgi:hypothetical protein
MDVREKLQQIGRYCFASTNHATATATIVIAIVTTVYAVVSGLQLSVMKRANGISAENLYSIQRPFIDATNVEATPLFNSTGITGYDINPRIENGGNSPPKKLVIYINYYTPIEAMPPDYKFPDLDEVISGPAVGGPKNVVRTVPRTFTPEQLVEFQNKSRHLYIYRHIEDDDTFRTTPHHVTQFCFELNGIRGDPMGKSGQQTLSLGFPVCRRHNCADEECVAQQ